ncbi:MAG: DNRLRE domain-containing protein [Fibrobacterota bacterium]
MKLLMIFMVFFMSVPVFSAFEGSGYWPEFYPYIHCDQEVIDSMLAVNARWQQNQLLDGWNKYRFGLVGNSVTNDGPFPSDMSTGCHAWCGTGISGCSRPNNSFWADFLSETWGGPGTGDDHQWLYDENCHGSSNGNLIGARTSQGDGLLQNAIDNLKPMWVTVMFGHNDRGVWNSDRRAQFNEIIDLALSHNIIPIMVTINPAKANAGFGDLNCPEYNDSVKAFAAGRKIPCIDWFGAAVDPEIGGCYDRADTCTRDGVHPERSNSSGHFADSNIFYDGTNLPPVCGLLNIMLLELTYELNEKVVKPAENALASFDYEYILEDRVHSTYIDEGNPSASMGSSAEAKVVGGSSPFIKVKKTLVKFDLSNFEEASVNSTDIGGAFFKMHQTKANLATSVRFVKMTTDWTESSANWTESSAGNSWTVAGMGQGDYDTNTAVSVNIESASTGLTSIKEWITADITDWVKAWIADPSSNYGMAIISESNFTDFYFETEDAAGFHPTLRVGSDTDLGVTGIMARTETLEDDLSLRVFPNPANPATEIVLNIPADAKGDASLRILDVQGRTVKTFHGIKGGAGRYREAWDGTSDNGVSVSSGIYVVSFQSGGIRKTKRFTLLR